MPLLEKAIVVEFYFEVCLTLKYFFNQIFSTITLAILVVLDNLISLNYFWRLTDLWFSGQKSFLPKGETYLL